MLNLLAHNEGGFFMLYNVIQDGETITYVPTVWGNVLLAALILALLWPAAFFARQAYLRTAALASSNVNSISSALPLPTNNNTKSNQFPVAKQHFNVKLSAKQLSFCAAAIALGTVLSNIKVFSFVTGGSITLLSMLVICLPGYWFGLGAGIMTGIAYGVLQMLIDPYILFPAQLIVDYLLAFGALGLSGLFCNAKYGLLKGYLTAVFGRYVFAVISGWIFFGAYAWEGWNPFLYSLAYNAIYIFSEAAITLAVLAVPTVRETFSRIKRLAIG